MKNQNSYKSKKSSTNIHKETWKDSHLDLDLTAENQQYLRADNCYVLWKIHKLRPAVA